LIAAVLALGATVATGLDGVAAGRDALLRGRRLGLLCHAASVTADGRHAVDVFRARGLDLRRLFAPEHGLRGTLAAGERVRDGTDAATGLPVVSLYGGKLRPSTEDLRDLDVLVVDLQDAGVRFYTYASTLILALEAARENGKAVVVLDRPNPLGGEQVDGPLSDPPEVVARSLVNRTPGPLVHGLTLGELAGLVAARGDAGERGGKAPPQRTLGSGEGEVWRPEVVPLSGWRREMAWGDTGLPWVPPSPNLRTAEAALVYPATGLLEATNLSEGRGTEAPFLIFGAPWLDASRLLATLSPEARRLGFEVEVVSFVPRAGVASPTPKHEGVPCRGARVRVALPRQARPYALGLALLAELRTHAGFRWNSAGRALDALVGSKAVRAALDAGRTPAEILAAESAAVLAFRRERAPFLLYR
jgi:uncharacterized protein YbbC (DUF1343 family)